MNIKTISVTYERKLNLGDFNSAAIGVTVWADVEDGEDPAAATNALFAKAKSAVKEQAMPLLSKVNAQTREFFMGKPVESAPAN
jgi:hypothetical protein